MDQDGYINKEDLFQLLKTSLRPVVSKGMAYSNNSSNAPPLSPTTSPAPPSPGNKSATAVVAVVADKSSTGDRPIDSTEKTSSASNDAGLGGHEDDPDEGARDLSDIALSLMDSDADGRISLDDFLTAVHNDELMLEILGPCLPTPSRSAAVLAAISPLGDAAVNSKTPSQRSNIKSRRPT